MARSRWSLFSADRTQGRQGRRRAPTGRIGRELALGQQPAPGWWRVVARNLTVFEVNPPLVTLGVPFSDPGDEDRLGRSECSGTVPLDPSEKQVEFTFGGEKIVLEPREAAFRAVP